MQSSKSTTDQTLKKMTTPEEIIDYIQNDSQCEIPMDRMFNEDGTHITKKQYGLVLLEVLCEELRDKFCKEDGI